MTLLQWTRYTKKIGDHEETKWTTNKNLARVFWGCWPSTLLSILCFFTKTLFIPWNRLFCLFLSVSLSFSLVYFTFPLSFSVSLYLVSCCFPSWFSCLLSPSLSFCFSFLPCFFAFVSREKNNIKYYIWKVSFHQLFLFWGVSCFVLSFKSFLFLFFVLSVVCFDQQKCFHFLQEDHF